MDASTPGRGDKTTCRQAPYARTALHYAPYGRRRLVHSTVTSHVVAIATSLHMLGEWACVPAGQEQDRSTPTRWRACSPRPSGPGDSPRLSAAAISCDCRQREEEGDDTRASVSRSFSDCSSLGCSSEQSLPSPPFQRLLPPCMIAGLQLFVYSGTRVKFHILLLTFASAL
jgi:hypothetical protein